MKKHIFYFIIINVLYLNLLHAQNTSIPDANFEQALIDLGIDSDGLNGQVLTTNINTLTDLYIIDKNISDLTGIQDFSSLTSLNCAYNNLTSIDISNNTDLESLDFSSNQITSINLNANLRLKTLICGYNQLGNLNISANDSLISLDCSNNQLTSIDVSSHLFLTKLTCSSNQFTNINVDAND